ncbi:MAG: hypothetical protein LBQ66_14205 [Planctomycetaceae bacterium]|nr:hypothetical protein [Planctomycetaceae bacterium]
MIKLIYSSEFSAVSEGGLPPSQTSDASRRSQATVANESTLNSQLIT